MPYFIWVGNSMRVADGSTVEMNSVPVDKRKELSRVILCATRPAQKPLANLPQGVIYHAVGDLPRASELDEWRRESHGTIPSSYRRAQNSFPRLTRPLPA